MMKKIILFGFGIFTLSLGGLISSAFAACSNPTGVEGNQVYNTTHKTMQFCDGTNWVSMRGGVDAASDTLDSLSCTDGQVAKWNNTSSVWECATLADGADNLGTGGTTTGTVYSRNTSGYGYFGTESANYIRFDDTTQGNEAFMRLGNDWRFHFTTSGIRPYANNAYDLGTSARRWRDGWFGRNVTATAYFHSSDERLKDNIETVSGLDLITKMRGVTYNWKSDGSASGGVIAQEIEKIMPSAVQTDSDGMKSVDYDQLIAPLIEAVKELKSENDILKERIEKLEEK